MVRDEGRWCWCCLADQQSHESPRWCVWWEIEQDNEVDAGGAHLTEKKQTLGLCPPALNPRSALDASVAQLGSWIALCLSLPLSASQLALRSLVSGGIN